MRGMDRDISFGVFAKREKRDRGEIPVCLWGGKGRKTCKEQAGKVLAQATCREV
jgi:hypothetical protein